MTALSEWENFYVIVGSSAGALIGLQFVVLTLIAAMPIGTRYGTGRSSVFHPERSSFWGRAAAGRDFERSVARTIALAAIVWGLLGLSGIVYEIIVARRMRVQRVYKPVFEDWLFHVLLPLAAYATLAVTAFAAGSHLRGALFGIGAAAMLLLFVGIHNAWDAVTYHVFESKTKP